MISMIRGKIADRGDNFVVVDVGGVGYKVLTSPTNKKHLGEEAAFYTYLHVKDDGMELYGFSSKEELALFESLLGVSSVGPKTALSVLSVNAAADIKHAIDAGKPELLMAPGVGKKTAERIVLELSGKLVLDVSHELVSALTNLGYGAKEAKAAARKVKSTELKDQIKEALRELKQ